MFLIKKKLLLVLSFLFNVNVVSQNQLYQFENFNVEDGLSQSQVNCIIQDKEGFLWIGTQDGVNRFDGYSFKVYRNNHNDPKSLSNNYILSIAEDKLGNLWIGTYGGGLNKFNKKTESFENYLNVNQNYSEFDANIITSIYIDSAQSIYLGVLDLGLYRFDQHTKKFYQINYSNENLPPSNLNIKDICQTSSNLYWIATENGLFEVKIFPNQSQPSYFSHYLPDYNITDIYHDIKNKLLYIATGNKGLYQFELLSKKIQKIETEAKLNDTELINSIYLDKDHKLWIGKVNGISVYEHSKKQFNSIKISLQNPFKIVSNNIGGIIEDKSGLLWFASVDGGIYKMLKSTKPFINNNFKQNNITDNATVWAIAEDKNHFLWIGTETNGLVKFDRKKNIKTYYKHNPKNSNSISANSVSSICIGKDGFIWVGTYGGGLNRFDRKTNSFIRFLHNPNNNNSLSNNYVYSLLEDFEGKIWIGTSDGLNCFDPISENFTVYKNQTDNNFSLSDNTILTLYEDKNKVLWIGTYGGGLCRFDKNNHRFINYKNKPNDKSSLSNNTILSIAENEKGDLWIGTDAGLNFFNSKTEKFKRFTEEDGLPNHIIYGVLVDKKNNVWFTTNKGIIKFYPNLNRLRTYDFKDGIQNNEFNQGAFYKSPSGEFHFGGINGLTSFYPEDIKTNLNYPQVVITKVKILNSVVSPNRFNFSENKLIVSYYENFISFEFSALDFTRPDKNLYKYRMVGFDKEWINAGNNRFATYTNLDPGNYIFQVKASNNDGLWNEKGSSLKLVVLTPYWMTWWFKILVLSIFIAIVFTIYKLKINRIVEIERLRTRIATDLHDDIGSSLTEISLNADLLDYEKDQEKSRRRISAIGERSREIIASISDLVWSIDSKNDSLNDLIDRMKDFAFKLLNEKGIDIYYKIELQELKIKLPLMFKQNIYLIFKEAINNIVKHSNATKVEITLATEKTNFIMIIKDNGKGLEQSFISKGNGLLNMKKRAEILGGKLDLISEKGLTIILKTKKI